jgi:hypothetical protein
MRFKLLLIAALTLAAAMTGLPPGGGTARAQFDDFPTHGRFCTATATAMLESCKSEGEPDYWKAVAKCINIEDDEERGECFDEAAAERRESAQECQVQYLARRRVCDAVGEDRYDPEFESQLFNNDFTRLTNPNRYFPLAIGNRWDYRGPGETVVVTVLNKTKLIDEVACIVVNDKVSENGQLVEDTDDWFAQARNGDVYYCGEQAKDFEVFEGDNPKEAELVSIDGSFKAGNDEGDKPGIIFRGSPTQGEVYRQEFSVGNAEDIAEVLSTTYAFGRNAELDRFVPKALADLFCPGDCVVTKESNPLEPDGFELKYFAPRVGMFLEVNPGTGEVVRLVGCNFDSRCNVLASQ